MNAVLPSFILSVTLFGNIYGKATCDFDQSLQPGWTYRIQSTGFPRRYVPGSKCRWVARAPWDQRVNVTCKSFNLPHSHGCQVDRLEIQDGNGRIAPLCEGRGFTYVTKSSRLTLTLVTNPNSLGGSFRCTVEAVESKECVCGRKNAPTTYRGNETAVHEYPFMAAIIDNRTHELVCSGTIINKKQVLTAAHCLAGRARDTFKVLVGAHDLKNVEATPGSMFFRTESFVSHENYSASTFDYDIALITVDGEFVFNEIISPVCLPFQRRSDSFVNEFTGVFGWGADHIVNGSMNALRKVMVGVISPYTCKSTYPNLTKRHICTQQRNIDLCGLNSGGPLTLRNDVSDQFVQIGILNKGPLCGPSARGLNFRVGLQLDWIEKNSPPDINFCTAE
ncbi:venom serine protease 34-like [Venturia canescens]|uniref:venom serine protease 34-like n=1 Tax=Venturia canescens TaxID=32260 RepID=UPI001C9C471F|nr:venom serine protease 34-like [Venturia canescens]